MLVKLSLLMNYGNYDQEMTDPVLSKRLSNVKNAVIPGFYGSANDGSKTIKTFPVEEVM